MGGIGHATAGWLREFVRQKPASWEVVALFSAVCKPEAVFRIVPELKQSGTVRAVEAGMVAPRFEQLQLPTFLERNRIDLYFNPCFTVPAIKTTRFQCSVVHDIVFIDRPEWVKPYLRQYLTRGTDLALSRADLVFTVSEYSRARILDVASDRGWERAGDLVIIRPSLSDTLRAVSAAAAPPGFAKQEDEFLLYLGAIEQKKGVGFLLDGYAVLREQMGERCPELVLVGGVGGQPFDLEGELSRRHLGPWVKRPGTVPDDRKFELLRSARAFVFPSLYEGFGIPPLEAMAFGTPVVATRATSLPEVLGEAALFVEPGDVEGLAAAMKSVLENTVLRDELAVKGRAQAAKYDWAQEVKELVSQFQRLEKSA